MAPASVNMTPPSLEVTTMNMISITPADPPLALCSYVAIAPDLLCMFIQVDGPVPSVIYLVREDVIYPEPVSAQS